jgi:diguanylate cyclase (GGDEF)-like protein
MGGEEFAVFSTVFTREEILKKAEALREAVQNYPFTYGGTLLKITISVGVVTTRKPSFDDIYLLADNLLYQAKQEGRNCVRSN